MIEGALVGRVSVSDILQPVGPAGARERGVMRSAAHETFAALSSRRRIEKFLEESGEDRPCVHVGRLEWRRDVPGL